MLPQDLEAGCGYPIVKKEWVISQVKEVRGYSRI